MTDGLGLLWVDDADDKNDNKSEITAFLCFYSKEIMQRYALVRFAYVLPFLICNALRKNFFPTFDFQQLGLLQGKASHITNN